MHARRGRPSVAEAEALPGRILDAAWDVLLDSGFDSFTFDRVARHAHIGKATIYSRFANKIDLMRALLLQRVALRTSTVQALGDNLPLEQAFALRAADIMKSLFSADGVLLERLIDWVDQELPVGQISARALAYHNAIESITAMLRDGLAREGLHVADVPRAARLWLEGVIGHARLAHAEDASAPEEIERWATVYARFYLAGLATIPLQ